MPPTVLRPPEATDFTINGTTAALTAANTPAALPGAFQIPDQNVAVIRSISLLANALLVTSNITWTLRFNEVPVQGWTGLTINPRAAGSVELNYGPEETQIPVPDGASVDLVVLVIDGGTYQLSGGVHGWYYPKRLEEYFQGAYGGA